LNLSELALAVMQKFWNSAVFVAIGAVRSVALETAARENAAIFFAIEV
jgi:hypothetical protein